MSHGTMKYSLKAHVLFCFDGWALSLFVLVFHSDFYTSENIINIET